MEKSATFLGHPMSKQLFHDQGKLLQCGNNMKREVQCMILFGEFQHFSTNFEPNKKYIKLVKERCA